MKDQSFRLIKRDFNKDTSTEIATYRIDGPTLEERLKYVICKNDKRIGWAKQEVGAMQIHDMYVRIHILHEDNSDPDYDARMIEVRSKPQNNGFLHDCPEEELAERKKQFWAILNS